MAVMTKMRENMTVILFALLVLFLLSMTVGGLVGGADILHLFGRKSDTIASINGEQISYEQFNQMRQQQIEAYQQQNQKSPSNYEMQNLDEQIWESMVRDVLVNQVAKEMGVTATRAELKYHLLENPPEFLKSNPQFADDNGNFDINKYQAALADERNKNYWTYIQNYLAATIPFNKIYDEVVSTVFVTDNEVKQDFIAKNQKVKVKYVAFDANKYKIDDSEISQKEIEEHYKKNKDNFKEEEKRKIQYVLFSLTPTASDTHEVKLFAESLLDSIKQGIDFAKLAQNYSEDAGSGAKGGDLGYFGKGRMVKPFEEAAFSAKVGDIIGPVKSQFGYHIIKVVDKKKENGEEQVKASHILLKIEASRSTQESAQGNASYFAEVAGDEGFNKAVKNEGLKADTTNFFSNSGFIPGLGMNRRMAESIFHSKIGKVSRSIYLEDKGYIIYELIDIQKDRIKPIKDVEMTIKGTIRREKQSELAHKACMEFRTKVQSPADFEKIAQQDSLSIVETEFFAVADYVRNVGKDQKFNGAAFGLGQDEISDVVQGTKGSYVIKLIEKQEIDEETYKLQKENLKQQLLEQKRNQAYTNWYTNLKENAEIKDFRYLFYY